MEPPSQENHGTEDGSADNSMQNRQVVSQSSNLVKSSLEEFQNQKDKPKKSFLGNKNTKILVATLVAFVIFLVLLTITALLKKQ